MTECIICGSDCGQCGGVVTQGGIIDVTEAHRRFGDLACIRNGVTTWIEVETREGVWRPVFNSIPALIGYRFDPK